MDRSARQHIETTRRRRFSRRKILFRLFPAPRAD